MGVTRAETELQDTVVELATHSGSWPAALRWRLLAALNGSCEVTCSASREFPVGQAVKGVPPADAIGLQVDLASTSPGTVSTRTGWLHRTLLGVGAATGLPFLRKRSEAYKSRPASVVISPEPITPGDCLALRGNASVALRPVDASGEAVIRHIVIEQLPHWLAPQLWSLPGRFEVWGEPASSMNGAASAQDPYIVSLGSFGYHAAAPASQAFELQNPVPLRGLRLSFQSPAIHGPEDFFCVYRIRAFEAKPPSCTEANGKTPARLVAPLQG